MTIDTPMNLQDLFALQDAILLQRLEEVLPAVMDECDLQMWIVIGDEYNEGPVVRSLLPSSFFHPLKTSLFIFIRKNGTTHRYFISKPDFSRDKFYTPALLKPKGVNWESFYSTFAPKHDIEAVRTMPEEDMWSALSRIIRETDPKNIALNFSEVNSLSDGLSKTNYDFLYGSIDDTYKERIISGEMVATRFLETRIPKEINLMKEIVKITRLIIKEAYSLEVITPNVTTTGEVRFYLMERAMHLGMLPWFDATLWIRRKGQSHIDDDSATIKEGDLLHCDFGIVYGRLCSDVQEMAYIKGSNDQTLIQELQHIHALSMQFQDIVMKNLTVGKSTNDVLANSIAETKQNGISKPMLCSSPIGLYGHGPDPMIAGFGNQEFSAGSGEKFVYNNTAYALELTVVEKVPSWDNLEIMYGQEINIAIIDNQAVFLSGRQERLHIIG